MLRLKRKGVIPVDSVLRIAATSDTEGEEIMHDHLLHHAAVADLREFCEMAITADMYPVMQAHTYLKKLYTVYCKILTNDTIQTT